jgi:predicted TIM-barrel fold metal-dependent hydrolase
VDSYQFLACLKENTLSKSGIDPALEEALAWNVFDANVRVGHSGVHGELALEAPELAAEMDRFGIKRALASHFAAEEYDTEEGNKALTRDADEFAARLTPAWAALPDSDSIRKLAARQPAAVRLFFGALKHNFSSAPWCAGELFEYLQANAILPLIAREDIEWNSLASILENFPRLPVLLLESGYRADRYLFPLLQRHPNLYFDSSTYVAHRQLEAFVERFGPDRLVFGSRLPLYTPGAALAVLATARIPDEARLLIAGGNLRRLIRAETGNK